jgi:hypothetical protein
MVAMFGRIIPAPLLMPVTATVRPPICSVADAAFGTVSVVADRLGRRAPAIGPRIGDGRGQAGLDAIVRQRSMITPVENGSTCVAQPSRAASAAQVERARARPSSPVPAWRCRY